MLVFYDKQSISNKMIKTMIIYESQQKMKSKTWLHIFVPYIVECGM